jgi:DNA-binding NarL/FixJ family response regulator
MAIRVALADDSFLVREALTQLLEREHDLEVVAVCQDADELRAALAAQQVDVVVTDIRMPPTNTDEGVRLAAELRETHPEVGVVLLSAHCEPSYALGMLETGSDRRGYLLKDRVHSGRQLTASIEAVAGGGSVIDPKVVESLVVAHEQEGRTALDSLSPRERDILAEMARGASNQAIADTLGMTKRGVEKHINAIFSKLSLPAAPDVSRRVRAVLMFLGQTERTAGGS